MPGVAATLAFIKHPTGWWGVPHALVGWDAGLRASRLGPCAVWHARRDQGGCVVVINAEPIPAALGT